jgi:hypothetical protein
MGKSSVTLSKDVAMIYHPNFVITSSTRKKSKALSCSGALRLLSSSNLSGQGMCWLSI